MASVKTIGIKDLKNNLSAYLRDVRRGDRILVSDRSIVVAELHEPGASYQTAATGDPILAEWIAEGTVSPPGVPKAPLPVSPVRLEEGAVQRLIDADRGPAR